MNCVPDWETQGCCPCFWKVAESLPPTPCWKQTVRPLPGPVSGQRTGGECHILASLGKKALTLELACVLVLVGFPGLHKPHQVWDFCIKIADLYASLPTVPPRRPTFLSGEGSQPALLLPVRENRPHGSPGPGHSSVRLTLWPWCQPRGP